MLPSKIYTIQLIANGSLRMPVQGEYFKILNATGAVDVTGDFGKLEGLTTGQGLEKTPFQSLVFKDISGGANTVKVFIGDENFIDGLVGTFAITSSKVPQSGGFNNTNPAVTNVSGSLLGVNSGRQYLLIQNKDLTGNIWIVFGAGATQALGVKIPPGGNYEPPVATTQQIFAIGDIASNVNVVVVEG